MNKEDLAKQMYSKYSDSLEESQVMPSWEELSEAESTAWVAVAEYVIMDINF
ncbi:hypothetical protein [Pontibacter diazotrophicus]|uniref:hypothetical protein n=1 Tax=Pontibacter diazotrophicus TaxID=1400979 RepID=UPI0015F13AFA|nr:hypothetical protein [Pontibacter diazotrophicus]